MKSLNSILALIIGATLMTAGVGCKKTPKPPTLIPGSRGQQVGDGAGVIPPQSLPAGNRGANGNPIGNDPTSGGRNLDPNTLPTSTPTSTTLTDPTISQPGGRHEGPEDRTALQAETVYFDYDRATVKASERPKLDRVATYLKNNASAYLRVEGHCDERGTEDYNRSLGERRALSAREYLVNSGVAPERVTTVTLGEDQPADPGHDETAWAKNRRSEFVVIGGNVTTGTQ